MFYIFEENRKINTLFNITNLMGFYKCRSMGIYEQFMITNVCTHARFVVIWLLTCLFLVLFEKTLFNIKTPCLF